MNRRSCDSRPSVSTLSSLPRGQQHGDLTLPPPQTLPPHPPPSNLPSSLPPSLHLRHFLAGPEQQQQLEPERIVEKKRKSDLDDYFTIPPLILPSCSDSHFVQPHSCSPSRSNTHVSTAAFLSTHTHTHTLERFTPLKQFCGFPPST